MKIAITGATGFLGRYIVAHLTGLGHHCRCWHRATSDRTGIDAPEGSITWIEGTLGDPRSARELVKGADAVVHAALDRPGAGFMGAEGDITDFVERNVVGSIRLIEAARAAGAGRFIFISTCAVHDVILGDRPLDEAHPTWAKSHYGAHKAALEDFVHSYGLGHDYPICALRPTGIYGLAHPPDESKWFDLIADVARGATVDCRHGGKEVHALDVARAVAILLAADGIAGQAYNCCDRYISDHEVATIARELSGSRSEINGNETRPKNQIVTAKLQALGMRFGGRPLLERTVGEILAAVGTQS